MPSFHIRVAGDDLVFSAGHFITLEDGRCERLHGHTYRVAVEIFGPPGDHQYVVDFLAVRGALKDILDALDHRTLLPTQHPAIRVASREGQLEATFQRRRWVLPEDDCLLLPMANTTTEMLAQYVGKRLLARLAELGLDAPDRVSVEVGEGDGAAATCELP